MCAVFLFSFSCSRSDAFDDPCIPIRDDFNSRTCNPFARAFPVCNLRVRQQINVITSYIDGSQVYGSDKEFSERLRGGKFILYNFAYCDPRKNFMKSFCPNLFEFTKT